MSVNNNLTMDYPPPTAAELQYAISGASRRPHWSGGSTVSSLFYHLPKQCKTFHYDPTTSSIGVHEVAINEHTIQRHNAFYAFKNGEGNKMVAIDLRPNLHGAENLYNAVSILPIRANGTIVWEGKVSVDFWETGPTVKAMLC